MGRGWNGFYLLRSYTLLSYTYPLPYPYIAEMINRISSSSPTGSGIPAPSPQWIIFFNKNKEMLTVDYNEGEERGRESEKAEKREL